MASNGKLVIEMDFKKSTAGTEVFKEIEEGAGIKTLYIDKYPAKNVLGLTADSKIRVTVEVL